MSHDRRTGRSDSEEVIEEALRARTSAKRSLLKQFEESEADSKRSRRSQSVESSRRPSTRRPKSNPFEKVKSKRARSEESGDGGEGEIVSKTKKRPLQRPESPDPSTDNVESDDDEDQGRREPKKNSAESNAGASAPSKKTSKRDVSEERPNSKRTEDLKPKSGPNVSKRARQRKPSVKFCNSSSSSESGDKGTSAGRRKEKSTDSV